jgi:hypothetical protein
VVQHWLSIGLSLKWENIKVVNAVNSLEKTAVSTFSHFVLLNAVGEIS